MAATSDTKALVQQWMSVGFSSPEGCKMVADDFVWYGPPSMADVFEGEPDEAAMHGPDGLARLTYLDSAMYAEYTNATVNTHFLIAEGDIAVWEFDAAFPTHDGEQYHNQYSITIRVRDGKIAEVREHADTLYSYRVCMGTPEKYAAVMDRLARLRSGEKV